MATDPLKALAVNYQAGERIVAAAEPGACMFLVQSGSVRLSRPSGGGGASIEIAQLEKGDFFGERALLEGGPYGVNAEAVEACEVIEIGPSTFHRLLRAHPEISVRLLRKLASRVERLERQLSSAAGSETQLTVRPAPGSPPRTHAPVARGP
nr:cyclic nucleotide-binding domain-containing protein [Acidobacteriota bacterium]